MGEEASLESSEKFQEVEARLNHILNQGEGVKTAYGELRNFYTIIGNDIKGAISRRLSRLMLEVNNFHDTYIRGKTPKKDLQLAVIERGFTKQLQDAPDINPQNTQALFQFLRELLPLFIQVKAHNARALKIEKKNKKIDLLKNQIHMADLLSRDVHTLYGALLYYAYFDQYALALIRSKVNRDDIKELVRDVHTVIRQSFKTEKNQVLDIRNLRAINLMTMRIRIRLGIYDVCRLHLTYTTILKSLPRQLVQQFNIRYFARRRDSGTSIDQLKETTEYKVMTKKFITLKLGKFYNLMRLYQVNMNRLFLIEDRIQKNFAAYIEKTEDKNGIDERPALLETLQSDLNDATARYLHILSGMPRNEDLKKNSIRTLFSMMINFYYNVLKDTYTPLTCREIAIRSMKQIKPPKEQMLTSTELMFLDNDLFKRDKVVLKAFFQGILSLVSGEEDEMAVIEPLMKAIGEDHRRGKKADMRQKTIDRFVDAISPAELDLLVQIFEIIPRDQERISSDLGKIYLETAEQYPASLKQKLIRSEKVEPTDNEHEKLRKIVTEKYDQLMSKTMEYHTGRPSLLEYLKKTQEEEQAYTKTEAARVELVANYNISNLITRWKSETDKTVIGLCLGSGEMIRPVEKVREFSRSEIRIMTEHFNSEHLGEIEKYYKTLNENIGQDYLKAGKPYMKIEYILLYAAKNLLGEFRNPARTYPRLHERVSAISGRK
ncbi:MAG: hypothetical protein ABIK68_01525 [bacterium]